MLKIWHKANLTRVQTSEADLTMRQMTVLLTVYMTPDPHTVRGLAGLMRVTKPVITRALDTLSRKGLIKRKRDEGDRRNVLIQRTVKGAVYLSELSDRIVEAEKSVDDDDYV
ncbi:MAG: MarR family transcriptional regulator [Alphaproteobacteria bacterium]|nr:MAG: MarR family transcriptional regulator [Alphaproteobacteria bacterium]